MAHKEKYRPKIKDQTTPFDRIKYKHIPRLDRIKIKIQLDNVDYAEIGGAIDVATTLSKMIFIDEDGNKWAYNALTDTFEPSFSE